MTIRKIAILSLAAILALSVGLAIAADPATAPARATPEDKDEHVAAPRRVAIDASAQRHLELTRATSGHLLVKPKINGIDVGWFIFDTGAGITCIDKGVADKLKLPDAGEITATGMGGNKQSR